MEPTNEERAARVASFIRQYVNATDGDCPIEEYHISDVIADLLHWMAQNTSAHTALVGPMEWPQRVLDRALMHFEAESSGDA